MSQNEQPPAQGGMPFNWRDLLGRKGQSEKTQLVRDLITVDKNLFGKTRIPNVFGMAVMGLLGAWGSTQNYFEVDLGNGVRRYPKTVTGLSNYFDARYRVDAMSAGGLSRAEYVTASLGYFLQDIEHLEKGKEAMISEGSRTKKK
jgi:hypothetical protein